MSVAEALFKTISEKGIAAGMAQFQNLKAKSADTYDFSEEELNRLGYQLLGTGKRDEAIQIFKLNVDLYTQSIQHIRQPGQSLHGGG